MAHIKKKSGMEARGEMRWKVYRLCNKNSRAHITEWV